jgi:putative salt-induced outer membrane protein YdiY
MLALAAWALAFSPAWAQDDVEFAGTAEAEEAEKPEATISAEFGGTWTKGNSEYYALNGTAGGSYKWSQNKLAIGLFANVGRAIADADGDGRLNEAEREAGLEKNAERMGGELRYDRFFGDANSLYVLAGAYKDVFSGYDLRSHEQVGYSRVLVDNDSTDLKAELGFDWAQENYVDGVEPNYQDIFAARVLVALVHQFNENVAFADTAEVYSNVVDVDDVRILNTASLSSKLSDVFSVKLSHTLTYDNVPVPGFEPLDHTTMVTLVASLL